MYQIYNKSNDMIITIDTKGNVINSISEENRQLKEELKYIPRGIGAMEAQKSFEALSQN